MTMLTRGNTRFGIAIPQMFPDGKVDMDLVSAQLKHVESLGYESVWVQDQMIGEMTTLEPFTLMTFASTVTTNVKLGTSVLVMPYRAPIHLAKFSASVDQISGGRLVLGIGIGGGEESYPAFGFNADHRVARFEEGIDLLKQLWTESEVTLDGKFWQMDKVNVLPKPLQKPHPPLIFGAHAPAALKRAVKLGNGWMGAGSSSFPAFKQSLGDIRGFMDEAGVSQSDFPLSKRVYIAVDRDREGAKKKLMKWFGQYYGNPELALKTAVWGPEEECIERLGEIYSGNLDLMMFNPVYDLMDQASKLAEDIIPKL